MLVRLDDRTRAAINRLSGDVDFKVFLDWLGLSLGKIQIDSSEQLQEVQLRWAQGKQQILLDILKACNYPKE